MNYPLILEYVESIKYAGDNLGVLDGLRPVMNANGNPCMSIGNFAVVFKMREEGSGKLYALKCFLREQEGRAESYRLIAKELEAHASDYLTPIQYLEKELFVDTRQTDEREFPVLLMDWVEGVSLDRHVRASIGDSYRLRMLVYQFGRLASWLGAQEFAHGDLKPDNILVRENGQLVLVDYDGMFVPAMRGERTRELGSEDFRHPSRSRQVFDGTIDDFALASIALSLKAIALKPELFAKYGAADRLLFSATDYCNPGTSAALQEVVALADDAEMSRLLGMFYIALAESNLAQIPFRLFNLSRPIVPEQEVLLTKVTDEDLAEAVEDEYGVKYSRDGLRLLKAPQKIEEYQIRDDVKVICDIAFSHCSSLRSLELPSSLTSIGDSAFSHCSSLSSLELPSSLTSIGDSAFSRCSSLLFLKLPSSLTSIGDSAFSRCSSLLGLGLPSSLTSIGDSAFSHCSSLSGLELPSSLTSIGDSAFSRCSSLWNLKLPSSLTSIGDSALSHCISLRSLELPSSLTSIGDSAFSHCSSLRSLELPSSLTSISAYAFSDCSSLSSLKLPSSLTNIGAYAFSDCSSLRSLELPSSLTSIGDSAFSRCSSLWNLKLPSSLTSIGDSAFSSAFSRCSSLWNLKLPSSLTSIGDSAFSHCTSLSRLKLPSSLMHIGDYAFSGCSSLFDLELPSSLMHIGDYAFSGCSSLKFIIIPWGTREWFGELLDGKFGLWDRKDFDSKIIEI